MACGIQQVLEQFKPCAAMVATQCIFAAMTLWVKATFGRGMSPMVFVVYRQAVATLVLAPITVMAKRTKLKEVSPGTRGFFLVFVAALIGATVNQNLCYQGLHLGLSSLATTMTNMIPAITFAMAVAVGQERVNIREISSIAKIFGTIVCVGGAATLAFFKGPKLLKTNSLGDSSVFLHTFGSKWVMGALMLIVSSSCWSLWLILQELCPSLSILGAVAIIVGLYVVLWGKADDAKNEKLAMSTRESKQTLGADCVGVTVEYATNISEPLLSGNVD